MSYIPLTDDIAVAPQLRLEDLDAIAAAGYKAVINNRPDGESPDQPPQEAIAARAAELGLEYRFVPVISGQFAPQDVAAFRTALDELAGPVVAFCRSGTRSSVLWALANAGRMPEDEIIAIAGQAGYDLSALRGRLDGHGH
ncbi:MAG: TIGR01244 family sulfur transferase [Salinarimonas sp.]